MAASTPNPVTLISNRLLAQLRSPLHRNGYALVFNSATTSGLGMVYWMLAARNYSTEAVGLNSATISAMVLLANIAQFGLGNVLNRFIPRAGKRTRRFILNAYLFSLSMALLVGVFYMLGIDYWTPALNYLRSNIFLAVGFILAIASWCIFVLQDSAMIGLRQAMWIPVENIIFSLIKIGLLVVFARSLSQYGIFASWTTPLIFLILPVNLLIFRYLVPRHVRETENQEEPVLTSQIARFVAGDYSSSLVWLAATNLMPILVIERAGATANAYFYLAWIIAYSLYLVNRNMGMSLTAEAAKDQTKLERYSYQTLISTAILLVPAVLIIVLFAPYILLIFGQNYAREGVTLLRLLALSALPNLVTSVYISIARVQRRVARMLVVLTALSTLALTLSYMLIDQYGLAGTGIAWLLSQTIIAVVLILTELRPILLANISTRFLLGMVTWPRKLWMAWSEGREMSRIRSISPEILGNVSRTLGLAPVAHWTPHRLMRTVGDMVVVTLGPNEGSPVAVLNLPRSERAVESFRRQSEVLATLHSDQRLGDWRRLIPELLAEGEFDGRSFWITNLLPGQEARQLLSDSHCQQRILIAAAATIQELHQCTSTQVIVDESLLRRWIDEPIGTIQFLNNSSKRKTNYCSKLERLSTELRDALAGKELSVSWVHGDYWPANILVSPDGAELTGIVDWDQARPDDLPVLDLLNLILSTRRHIEQREIGDILHELLDQPEWKPVEEALLAAGKVGDPDEIPVRVMLLLYWLRHLQANLQKSKRFQVNPLWVAKNYEAVLSCL